MNIHRIYDLFLPHFRRRRNEWFCRIVNPQPGTTILDVGGYHWFWSFLQTDVHITLLNLDVPHPSTWNASRYEYVKGDARCLPFADKSFDVVFSNSVIEHVGTLQDQQLFAAEIQRVARTYWVQTPNRRFFVEPHLVTPFIHYFPKTVQRNCIRYMTVWGLVTKPTRNDIDTFLEETRLLTRRELTQLFPGGSVITERFLGFGKSFILHGEPPH